MIVSATVVLVVASFVGLYGLSLLIDSDSRIERQVAAATPVKVHLGQVLYGYVIDMGGDAMGTVRFFLGRKQKDRIANMGRGAVIKGLCTGSHGSDSFRVIELRGCIVVQSLDDGHELPPPEVGAEEVKKPEPVPLFGYVRYSSGPGESLPDVGATVIALPAGKTPSKKISALGLRSYRTLEDDVEEPAARDLLRSFGASFGRAYDGGRFELVVPRAGDYSLLIVSHHAFRPEGQAIALADEHELGRIFESPRELIGQHRYAILPIVPRPRGLSDAVWARQYPLTHEFGPTDKD